METSTRRLRLTPLTAVHRAEAIALWEDPRTWVYIDGSPADAAEAVDSFVASAEQSRSATGLGIWAALLRDDVPDEPVPANTFVGLGGVRILTAGPWNLGISVVPAAWGRGFARELAQAAVDAAHTVAPDRPVTARALAGNVGSDRVLTNVGLNVAWEGPSTETPGAVARVYADTALDDDALAWLVEHS